MLFVSNTHELKTRGVRWLDLVRLMAVCLGAHMDGKVNDFVSLLYIIQSKSENPFQKLYFVQDYKNDSKSSQNR